MHVHGACFGCSWAEWLAAAGTAAPAADDTHVWSPLAAAAHLLVALPGPKARARAKRPHGVAGQVAPAGRPAKQASLGSSVPFRGSGIFPLLPMPPPPPSRLPMHASPAHAAHAHACKNCTAASGTTPWWTAPPSAAAWPCTTADRCRPPPRRRRRRRWRGVRRGIAWRRERGMQGRAARWRRRRQGRHHWRQQRRRAGPH